MAPNTSNSSPLVADQAMKFATGTTVWSITPVMT